MDIGTLLLMVGLSYGLGVLWYDLLPASVPDRVWRVAAYPFIGIFAAEALIAPMLNPTLQFGGVNFASALIGSFVGVLIDWAITEARRPSTEAWPHLRQHAKTA